ncbi:MAG: glycosyltransferase family 4 protein [Sulfurifustis sp.]
MSVKLLYVVNDAAFFVSHRLPVAVAAKATGFDVHVAAPAGSAVGAITQAGIHFHPVPFMRAGLNVGRELQTLMSLIRLLRILRPTIVHTVTIKPVLYGGIVVRLLGSPALVSAVPGLGYVFIARGLTARLRRWVVKLAYRVSLKRARGLVIFQNADDRAAFLAAGIVNPDRARLIRGSGVDLARYIPCAPPANETLIILPARMLWDKGVGEFVEAARILKAEGVRARFALVGDIDRHNPAAVSVEMLREWTASGPIEWWGFREDMPSVYAQAHVVCLPSYREGLPKALLEAVASARPIVTTDVPGCREVVRPGYNGFLVPPRDAAALARSLRTLIDDPALRTVMGARGRQIAEREFGIEQVVRETLNIYQELVRCG